MSQTTETMTVTVQNPPLKRCAIIGTAPSWRQTPWQDTTLEILGLNDAYILGLPRIDRWFDLHRFAEMVLCGSRKVPLNAVPVGAYTRPQGHIDWLRTQALTKPVMLQDPPPDGWTHAEQFPLKAVLAFWQRFWPWRIDRAGVVTPGPDYEVSTPALMLMWAVWAGYTEIHIYGIHLATEWEYVSQRPNMEMLIGIASGLGIKVVLPHKTPLCRGSFRYAYEPKADLPVQAAQRQIELLKAEGARLQQKAAALPWWARGQKKDLGAHVAHLNALLMDAKMQHAKARAQVVLA